MFKKIKNMIVNDDEMDDSSLRLLSLLFLLIAGSMSFLTYTYHFLGIEWWDSQFTFHPRLMSTVVAIFLIAPLYLRGILKWNKSLYSLISLLLILLLFSSFTELATGGKFTQPLIMSLIGSAIVLSWLGIKAVAGVSWMLAFIAGLCAVYIKGVNMDFYGFIYISSGFIGLVLHSGLNPGQLLYGIKKEYSSSANSIISSAKQDMAATAEKL